MCIKNNGYGKNEIKKNFYSRQVKSMYLFSWLVTR